MEKRKRVRTERMGGRADEGRLLIKGEKVIPLAVINGWFSKLF